MTYNENRVKLLNTRNLNEIRKIINKYPDFLTKPVKGSFEGNSLLMEHLSYSRWFDGFKLLVELGADVNFANSNGCTALLNSVMSDDIRFAKLLLENQASVDGNPNFVSTPLISICDEDKLEWVKLFVSYGANVNRVNINTGFTALDASIVFGTTKISEYLKSLNAPSAIGYHKLDWSKEYGNSIIQFCDNNICSVLPTTINQIINKTNLDIRIGQLSGSSKYLFTIGLFKCNPPIEIGMTISSKEFSIKVSDNKPNIDSFPIKLLTEIAKYRMHGNAIQHGTYLSKDITELKELIWFKDIEGVMFIDIKNDNDEEHLPSDTVTILTIFPVWKNMISSGSTQFKSLKNKLQSQSEKEASFYF